MKKSLVFILVLTVCFVIPLMAQEKATDKKELSEEMAKGEMSMTPPEPLNNEWFNWLEGEWQGWSESPMGKSEDHMKVEMGLNDQFLIMKYTGKMAAMTPEQKQQWQEAMGATEEEVEKMANTEFKGIGLLTIDSQSGEIVGHWFDSWRNMSKGHGRIEGNKEIMEWSGAMGTGTRTVEKVGEDKLVVTEKWNMPDGSVMESKSEMTRVKEHTEKKS